MAHVLQARSRQLERGVRFAWWPGHSFGRYAGSTWYVDRFWADLDQHCVAYTNLDGPGRRGSPMDQVSAGGWPGIAEYSVSSRRCLTSKTPESRGGRNGGLFRPTRDSDSSFQGLGIPEFSIGVPGPPRGHPDLEAGGRISYWHTAQDTIEKLDPKALELDTQYRVAQLYSLATVDQSAAENGAGRDVVPEGAWELAPRPAASIRSEEHARRRPRRCCRRRLGSTRRRGRPTSARAAAAQPSCSFG